MASSKPIQRREWLLAPETELRCKVGDKDFLTVKLLEGTAEIFGIEMPLNKAVTFTDDSLAVFTWYGCTLETVSASENIYQTDSTPMVSYINTHAQLEAMRDVALAAGLDGPNVMVVGPTTVARVLSAYAVRLDRTPIYVDLDVSLGSFSVPGCITAVPLEKACMNVEVP